jgi:hypothetical protein
MKALDPMKLRILRYFEEEDPEWWLPLDVFPLIDFEKSKQHLSFVDYQISQEQIEEVHQLVFNYIMSLDITSLVIPRSEYMQKYSTQRYNDAGIVRFDYERPTNSFDSSFKYQRFITQPLTPREVWLPGKAIKQNNAFMMFVHRQILECDPVYPSTKIETTDKILKKVLDEGLMMFDISGFGFQYLREILIAANNAIRELYPSSEYEEQSEIMEKIFKNISVQMPSGEVLKPPRGVGLGYYEDLKTIGMMAILRKFHPISIYGDQGILPINFEYVMELMRFSFIMNDDKTVLANSRGQLKWGGIAFNKGAPFQPSSKMNSLIGSFFSRSHWERKMGLYSYSIRDERGYKLIQKRLADTYLRLFGYEFNKQDIYHHFMRGGIMTDPLEVGYQKIWWIRDLMTVTPSLMYDTMYQTPFKATSVPKPTWEESKAFQKKRRLRYKAERCMHTELYDYVNPMLTYNKKTKLLPRVFPRWADLSLLVFHGISSGTITCGLSPEEIELAAVRQRFATDPFRARATGGYQIQTTWRSERPPSQEMLDMVDYLKKAKDVSHLKVRRTDLPQFPHMSEDPMYYNDNLIFHVANQKNKRKASSSLHSEQGEITEFVDGIRNILPHLIKRSKVTNLTSLVSTLDSRLEQYANDAETALSDHGLVEEDEDFLCQDLDIMLD